MLDERSNIELLKEYDERVVGNTAAKKSLINMINKSRVRSHFRFKLQLDEEQLPTPLTILLAGASGTGKSHLVRSLARIVDFPLVCVDANQLGPTGGSGGITPRKLQIKIFDAADEYYKKHKNRLSSVDEALDQTVVFIDEFDKLAYEYASSNWNQGVQAAFLTILEAQEPAFAGVSFILAGAFSPMLKKEKAEKKKSGLGFNFAEQEEEHDDFEAKLVAEGLMPEIVGRIDTVHEMQVLTEEDYSAILTRLIRAKTEEYMYRNFDISTLDIDTHTIVKKAIKSGQGARSMIRDLNKIMTDIEFDLEYDTSSSAQLFLPLTIEEL